MLINVRSPSPRPLKAPLSLLIASKGPTNLPFKSTSSTPNCFKYSIVWGRWIRVKIVRKPVPILSALSRVVALTLVNKANNSLRLPPDDLNTPPVLRTTSIKSPASTANAPATALIEPSCFSNAPTPSWNWAKIAIAPSVVSVILSKLGARADFANTLKALDVSSAVKPA